MAQDQYNSFPAVNIDNWREAAKKELGGKDPFETLAVEKDGLHVKPYYDASDTEALSENILNTSYHPLLGPRGWHNTPIVTVVNSENANKTALVHLNNGADGIVFRVINQLQIDKVLSDIQLPHCSTFFLVEGKSPQFVNDLVQYANAKGFDKTQIVGGIFWESPENSTSLVKLFEGWEKFHVLGNVIAQNADPTQEIVNALIDSVNTISQFEDDGGNSKDIFQHFAFSFAIGTDFFTEIAKLKAFRRLWNLVRSAYRVTYDDSMILHGLSKCWNNENYQPNANMLKSTTAALSAILGGCDLISIEPEEEDSVLKSRISRNVLTLLREESHLNQTSDPTAGSYYLDSLTDQIAQVAWSKFQKEVKG